MLPEPCCVVAAVAKWDEEYEDSMMRVALFGGSAGSEKDGEVESEGVRGRLVAVVVVFISF